MSPIVTVSLPSPESAGSVYLEAQPDWNGLTLEPKVMEWIASKGYATGKVMNALRVTLVGAAMGPQIFCITDFIGREETLRSARKAVSELSCNG